MKDDTDRMNDGTLPHDPMEDAEPFGPSEGPGHSDPKQEPGGEPVAGEDPLQPISSTIAEALARAERRMKKIERPVPIPWPDYAEQMGGGYWPGLHVYVGGTGTGKTQKEIQTAIHAARQGVPVLYVGLELDDFQLGLRALCEVDAATSGDPRTLKWSKFFTGQAKHEELERAHHAAKHLEGLPLYLVHGRPQGWAMSELATLTRRLRDRHPQTTDVQQTALLVMDFLQLVGDETDVDGRPMRLDTRERIGKASYFARDLAMNQNVAIVLVSSVARDKYGYLSCSRASSDSAVRKAAFTYKTVQKGMHEHINRYIGFADPLIGLGKESGEIEYSADSLTVALRGPMIDGKRSMVMATAKGRYTGARWCELRWDNTRFSDSPDHGAGIAKHMCASEVEDAIATSVEDLGIRKSSGDAGAHQ